MAYLTKEMKNELVAEVKKVMPKTWKATYALRDMSTLIVTIRKAPLDLQEVFANADSNDYRVNEYHVDDNCQDKEVAEVLKKIIKAMNGQNHDNSDRMRDYFDIGYYTELRFGDWKKDFETI